MRWTVTSAVRPAPGLLTKLGGSIALTFVLMALVEIFAGLLVPPTEVREIPGDVVSRTITYLEINPAPLVRDEDLLWRNEPGARKTQPVNPRAFGRDDRWTIENNSRGFRGPELADDTEERLRVLCVGDSITFGFSVDQPDTYPQQLLGLLEDRYPGKKFDVINAGVPGWSYLQGLRFLDLRGTDLEPDIIVIGHGTNDQLFPAKVTDEERFLRLAEPSQRLFQRLAVLAAETNTYRALTRGAPPPPNDEPSPGCKSQIAAQGSCRRMTVDQIASTVHEVAVLAKKHGIDLLVANTDFVQTAAVVGVKRSVEAHQVPFVDLVQVFNRRRAEDEDARADRLGLPRASAPTSSGAVAASKSVLLRVAVPDPSRSYRVEGFGYFQSGLKFAEPLFDDGTHGDERPSDGVFSVTVSIAAGYGAVAYKYYAGETAEFEALPPFASTLGDRVLRTPGNRVGPVDVFGQSLFMVERAHPDRDGHRVIAELITDELEKLPSFRDFVRENPE